MDNLGCRGFTKYQVKVLSCHAKRDINQELIDALDENPSYEGVEIVESFIRSSSLYPIMNNQHLQYLQICNSDSFIIDFDEGIAPILGSCGGSLSKLVLDKFTHVDLEIIGRNCPKLKHLSLSHVISWGKLFNICSSYFCSLEELRLTNEYGCHIISNIHRQLLFFSSNLQYIHFQLLDSLDDLLWAEVLLQNPLTNLVSLTFEQCHSISGDPVFDLVQRQNKLQALNIWSCRFVTSKHKELIKKVIQHENFDICFRCLPFMGFVSLPLPPVDIGNLDPIEVELFQEDDE